MNSESKRTKHFLSVVLDYAVITLGAAVYAVSVTAFTAPNNIAPGGFSGIGTILNYLFGFPIGIFVFVANIPLFIWGAVENGKNFLAKTVYATAASSVFIDLFTYILPSYHGEKMLAAIFGGLISGVGLALVFHRGGTTGGTDIIARNVHKHLPFVSMGMIILLSDTVILVAAAIAYQNIESALFAAIAIFVSARTLDTVIYGVAHDNGKLMFIISDRYEELSSEIISRIYRGVTIIDAHGGYKHSNKKMLMCALRPNQVHKVNKLVREIDESAFVIVTTATAINGKGFSIPFAAADAENKSEQESQASLENQSAEK